MKNEKISLVDYSYEISKRVGAGESVSSAAGRANGYVKVYAELDDLDAAYKFCAPYKQSYCVSQ